MRKRLKFQSNRLLALGVALCAWSTFANAANAQNDRYGGFTSRVDLYGNAEVGFDDRRVLEVYQNQVQRNALERYQEFGRRPENRGGYEPFAFPNDMFIGSRPPRWLYQRPTTAFTPADERTFSRYGGFGDRVGIRYGGDIASILSRRNELLRATSLNAPVRRAMMERGGSSFLPDRLRSTPFFPGSNIDVTTDTTTPLPADGPAAVEPGDQKPSSIPQPPPTEISLTERLQSNAESSRAAALNEAWSWFKGGEFRRALRSFDVAASINRTDLEPQVGRFFCYAALGSFSSALTQLRFVSQRIPQPFVTTINVRAKFATPDLARDFGLQIQLQTQSGGDSPLLVALQAFTLWHLGEYDEAQRTLNGVEKSLGGTIFRDWPVKMREARAAMSQPAPLGTSDQ